VRAPFTILIADRNRYVREFLRRELTGEGYQVMLAKSGQEVLELIDDRKHADLLILDLDVPGVKELSILEKAEERVSPLPVVVHSFSSDYLEDPSYLRPRAFVEKMGTNIDYLKRVVLEMLEKFYPIRFNAESHMERGPDDEEMDLK